MKHARVVKAVEINGKLYTNPKAAAKRWVEAAANAVHERAVRGLTYNHPRWRRSWYWCQNHWVVSNEKRIWRRVLPIFERLLR